MKGMASFENRELILELRSRAKDHGFKEVRKINKQWVVYEVDDRALAKLVREMVEEERETCAQIADPVAARGVSDLIRGRSL